MSVECSIIYFKNSPSIYEALQIIAYHVLIGIWHFSRSMQKCISSHWAQTKYPSWSSGKFSQDESHTDNEISQ